MSFGSDGNLYVSSSLTDSVLRYNGQTGAFIDTFATEEKGSEPDGLSFGPDGNLYIANFRTNNILRYNGKTGAFIDTFVPSGSGGLNGPVKPIFGTDGNLYVSGLNSNNILRYDGKTGAFIDTFIPAGRGGLNGAGFLAFTEDSTVIPESRMGLAVLALGTVLGTSKVLSRKQKARS